MKILYASNNKDKINDIKTGMLFIDKNIEVVGLEDTNILIDVEETESTLLGNAKLKAKAVYELLKENNPYDAIIGEDFGFFVEAFPHIAGLHAKRWMSGTNLDRAKAIVNLFETTKEKNRTAIFACAMFAILKKGKELDSYAELKGQIGTRIPTHDGFGYHQIVIMEDGRYLNDYKKEEKQKIWSRQKALEQIVMKIKQNK